MPGLLISSKRMVVSESVTALIIFFRMDTKSSLSSIFPLGSDLDIFLLGSARDMIRVPTEPNCALGMTKTSPNRLLNRWTRSRVNSKCCTWSSPTGTICAS